MTKCRICGNDRDNRTVTAREMMFGLREPFPYLECARCGTLQIVSFPADMRPYYPANYYSMRASEPGPLKDFLKRQLATHAVSGGKPLGALILRLRGAPQFVEWLKTARVKPDDRVLDVGCGQGHLLLELQRAGFTRLTGVDPFVDADIEYPGGVRILRRELAKVEGEFDFIMFHHSFEHVPDPLETLKHAHRLLAPRKFIIIRIPVADSVAWRTYGVNWSQLDAPRHFHLFTVRSMDLLAKQAGLELTKVVHDSTGFGFWGSELLRQDIPLRDPRAGTGGRTFFSRKQLREFERQAKVANKLGEGDAAAFYLQKT